MLENISTLPLDPIFALQAEYEADPSPKKVNLGLGLYSDEKGRPFVFPSVKKAFARVDTANFDYPPIGGNRKFLRLAAQMVFGTYDEETMAMQATCGGTQAQRLCADLVFHARGETVVYLGMPTWGNYFVLFGGHKIERFHHLDSAGEVDFDEYIRVVREAPPGAILVIQGALAHNPSGKNLSMAQLQDLLPLIKAKRIFLCIDFAYLGLSEGLLEDCEYVRVANEVLDEFACGLSFSKNASLCEHRVGALFVKSSNAKAVESQLQQLCRESISMAPGIGQEVVIHLLQEFFSEWRRELEEVRRDIEARKQLFVSHLPLEYAHLREARGMFCLLPLTESQVLRLKEEFSVYTLHGRVNFAGVTADKIAYLAESVQRVL